MLIEISEFLFLIGVYIFFGFILLFGLNVVLIFFSCVNKCLLKNLGLYLLWYFLLCLFYIKLLYLVVSLMILFEIWWSNFFCLGLYILSVGCMCSMLVLIWLNILYCKLWLLSSLWNFIIKLVKFLGGIVVFLVKVNGFWLFFILFKSLIDFLCIV